MRRKGGTEEMKKTGSFRMVPQLESESQSENRDVPRFPVSPSKIVSRGKLGGEKTDWRPKKTFAQRWFREFFPPLDCWEKTFFSGGKEIEK